MLLLIGFFFFYRMFLEGFLGVLKLFEFNLLSAWGLELGCVFVRVQWTTP